MKIQSLTLHGFKSFADRTRIDFHEGITAIVGPNGCGKSNISDALRWVLGEQRPTAIRGSRMEEAIFEGTTERRPIHRAEVGLALSNADGLLAVPYSEVVIGRTVYRGGESEYTLNESPCRLRDLLDLCRDTGLGTNAYSIIEGRMVDAILSDRAEERRALFEEAAEVGRYKDRRRGALRRLEQAEVDLKRLDDLLGEVESKVRSLARQRGKAERYLEQRDRRLQLEVAVAEARLAEIGRRLGKAEAEVERLRGEAPAREGGLRAEELEVERLRLEMAERERERSVLASRLEETRARLEELERQRLVAGERAGAAEERRRVLLSELEALERRTAAAREDEAVLAREAEEREAVIEELRRRAGVARRRVDTARSERDARHQAEAAALAELAELIRTAAPLEVERRAAGQRAEERRAEAERRRAERERLSERVAGLEGALTQLDEERAAAEESLRAREAELQKAREAERRSRAAAREATDRLAALEGEVSAERARVDGLEALLQAGKDLPQAVGDLLTEGMNGVRGVLADSLRVPSERARALEALLGPYLYGVVVDDWRVAARLRAWLLGRAGEPEGLLLLPLEPGPRPGPSTGGGGLLAEVEVEGPGAEWARALLTDVALREEGFEPAAGAWVLPDGSGQDRLGAVRIGQPSAGRGVLSRRAELSQRRKRLVRLEAERAGLAAAASEAARESESRVAAREELEASAVEAERRVREAAAAREATAERLERAGAALAELEERLAALEASIAEEEGRVAADVERLSELAGRREEAEGRLAAVRARSLEAAEEWERESGALHELQVELAAREAEARAAGERALRLKSEREGMEGRLGRVREELEELEEAAEGGRTVLRESEEEVVALLAQRERLQRSLREAQEALDAGRGELEEREAALRAARREEREAAERRHTAELEIAELRGQRTTIRERLEAEWEVGFEELRERVTPPGEGSVAEWARELEEIRDRLLRMGPVNLLAAEEYSEERERLDFLQTQRADLVEARDDLLESIRRINEAAAAAFREVFDRARANFQRIFVTLFEGGEADVWLEDPDDPLDSPIEIAASPRGKRVQRIHLLSGGERALTALALLFGIYLTKPSPFCVMDEVDAPLDESNIGRFTAMLERFKTDTQFIVITHNPRTIEAADWVYGVTMQEPGVSSIVGVELQGLPRGQVA